MGPAASCSAQVDPSLPTSRHYPLMPRGCLIVRSRVGDTAEGIGPTL